MSDKPAPTLTSFGAQERIPIRIDPRAAIQARLKVNQQAILSLPLAPLIQIQYLMAVTGNRYTWDQETNTPVVMIYPGSNQPWALDAEVHMKILDKMTSRLLPMMKAERAVELDQKTFDAEGSEVQDMRDMKVSELKAELSKLTRAEDATKPQ